MFYVYIPISFILLHNVVSALEFQYMKMHTTRDIVTHNETENFEDLIRSYTGTISLKKIAGRIVTRNTTISYFIVLPIVSLSRAKKSG